MLRVQAIAVDRGDERALLGLAGFLLDQRRQRHELAERQVRIAAVLRFEVRVRVAESHDHHRDELRNRRAARQRVRLREEIALEIPGSRIEIVHERRVARRLDEFGRGAKLLRFDDRRHLPNGQTFWKRDRVAVDVAAGDLVDDLDHAHGMVEAVLTRFQRS